MTDTLWFSPAETLDFDLPKTPNSFELGLVEALPKPQARAPQAAKVISVQSLNSAAGRSVIAANLAFELAATGGRVCLLDLDTQWPSQHRYFGLPNDQASVIAGVRYLQQDRLTKEAFQELRIRLVSKGANVDLVSGYGLNLSANNLDWNGAEVFVEFLGLAYSHVIIDLPAGNATDAHRLAAKLSTIRLNVLQPDPISIARYLESPSGNQGFLGQDVLVINRLRTSVLGARPEWQVRQTLKDRTALPIIGVLPEDPVLDTAMLQGVPLRQLGGKSKFRVALQDLAKRLA